MDKEKEVRKVKENGVDLIKALNDPDYKEENDGLINWGTEGYREWHEGWLDYRE